MPINSGRTVRPNLPVLYLDESGNTGDNYLDAQQPVHVLAGFLVPEGQEPRLRQLLDALREAGAPLECHEGGAGELKSTKLLRAHRWARATAKTVSSLCSEFLPVSVIVEKRFFAAVKVAETLLHHDTNPFISAEQRTPAARTELAEQLSRLSDAALKEFSRAYANPSADAFAACIGVMKDELAAQGQGHLVRLLQGGLDALPAIVAEEQQEMELWHVEHPRFPEHRVRAGARLALDAFFASLTTLDRVLRHVHPHPANIVYDEAEEGRAFELALWAAQEGGHVRHIGRAIPGLSHQEDALQAADLLAGILYRVAKDGALNGVAPTDLDAVLAPLVSTPPASVRIGSKAFSDRIKVIAAQAAIRRQRAGRSEGDG
ncbi:DUF3800 domain-containing protein [Aggregicoccus sp. 17bor-14]|uniref:DUF3800 domain-containing protein n=1 Tax=Myxococcaceae TaxID=31 RepID=UPI00129C4C79|nr:MULTISPECIES: DUF3800 domain-containing protein [Myxococcaceae]MBF5043160.1 DUF3800 domain-containing protein [Simulacricoccus sp. 17bor-14]MRI88919.1 DUF3800 domain-containing protein [Aggregicoccus sp. 17bor-14]